MQDAIAELQDAAPAVTPGATVKTGIGSPEWDLGFTSLTEACRADEYEWSIEMYTGGQTEGRGAPERRRADRSRGSSPRAREVLSSFVLAD